jgi:hypothetical protein
MSARSESSMGIRSAHLFCGPPKGLAPITTSTGARLFGLFASLPNPTQSSTSASSLAALELSIHASNFGFFCLGYTSRLLAKPCHASPSPSPRSASGCSLRTPNSASLTRCSAASSSSSNSNSNSNSNSRTSAVTALGIRRSTRMVSFHSSLFESCLLLQVHTQTDRPQTAPCSEYLCPGTLSCVSFPHHCPCAWEKTEDKVELGEGIAVCGSKGGWSAGEFAKKVELARKGVL